MRFRHDGGCEACRPIHPKATLIYSRKAEYPCGIAKLAHPKDKAAKERGKSVKVLKRIVKYR